MSTFRRDLYRAARLLGTIDAAAKGPVPLGKRLVRKKVYAKANGKLARVLRRAGL